MGIRRTYSRLKPKGSKGVHINIDILYLQMPTFRRTTESNTSVSYLDLLLSIGRDGQLRTSLYDKRDDFNFHITNFPFLSSNIPSSPAYGVFISQLVRYARACSSYECFILRAMRLSNKLLGQGYVKERLKSSLRKFYGRYGDLTKPPLGTSLLLRTVPWCISLGFSLFWHLLVITFPFFKPHVWLRITDEGSVSEIRMWSISLIKSD